MKDIAMSDRKHLEVSPYRTFKKAEWARLRADTPMTLTEADLEQLSGINERLSVEEAVEVYLPMSRLLNFHVEALQELHSATTRFLGQTEKTPFILGIGGSVAVGKSTSARVLQALLARWPNHPRVDLVPTDGFLLPNAELEKRDLMNRKGFPESFDISRLLRFMADVKAGRSNVSAPVYSHFAYDILPDKMIVVDKPDILIVEGLNVLQPARLPKDGRAIPFVSDYFDFSIYIHAEPKIIEKWYIDRFQRLRTTAFRDPASYFHRYSKLDEGEALKTSQEIWNTINLVNLQKNILPTRQRANLIVKKGQDHAVESVVLRKL